MKSDNPRFSEQGEGVVCCDDCPFDITELCIINGCPTKDTYADAVALAEGEPNH